MLDVNKLYPQYNFVQDRRKQNLPVAAERRSGLDRRSGTRIKLDTNLTKDIFDVKNRVSQTQNTKTPKVATFTQNAAVATRTATNSIVHKVANFIVENRKNLDVAKQTENIKVDKKHASDGMLAGVLSTFFVGTVAATFLGNVAGIVAALGLGGVMGVKAFKSAVVDHLKHK